MHSTPSYRWTPAELFRIACAPSSNCNAMNLFALSISSSCRAARFSLGFDKTKSINLCTNFLEINKYSSYQEIIETFSKEMGIWYMLVKCGVSNQCLALRTFTSSLKGLRQFRRKNGKFMVGFPRRNKALLISVKLELLKFVDETSMIESVHLYRT